MISKRDWHWIQYVYGMHANVCEHVLSSELVSFTLNFLDAKIPTDFLDPSYTINIVVLQGPDMDRAFLRGVCLEMGYSWKALRGAVKWIDYGDGQE